MRGYFFVVGQLIRRDLVSYRKDFWGKLLDTSIMLVTNIGVFAYLLPKYGMRGDYGPFFLVSAIAAFGFFDTVGKISLMMADLEGDRTISYLLTLPVPSSFIFGYYAIWWGLTTALTTLLLFPQGKLLLWDQFDLSAISYWRLLLMFVTINIFYGVFSLWITAIMSKIKNIGHLWVRVLIPLYMFGCYFYPWQVSYEMLPHLAFVTLVNPIVFAMEGMRAATLGQASSIIPFAVSLLALWLFIVVLGYWAIARLKRRLDCV